MEDRYFSAAKTASVETKVKGSRFIGRVRPAASLEKATQLLEEIRREEHAATHNCFAYRVGFGSQPLFKYSDDGEPSGTAGKPIYDTLEGRKLTDTIVVVTRYYGGTKLGTGGLVRAYSEAAGLSLDEAGIRENFLSDTIMVEIQPALYNQLTKIVRTFGIIDQRAEFTEKVSVRLVVRKSHTERLIASVVELSNGQATIKKLDDNETN